MFVPKWVLILFAVLLFVANYTESKEGLFMILHDLNLTR